MNLCMYKHTSIAFSIIIMSNFSPIEILLVMMPFYELFHPINHI